MAMLSRRLDLANTKFLGVVLICGPALPDQKQTEALPQLQGKMWIRKDGYVYELCRV